MELLKRGKDRLKDKVRLLYQSYGQLCASKPLPMIISSVTLVILCSLPLLSHPVFERTATFLVGRIQIGKYKTNVSVASSLLIDKSDIIVKQLNIELNVNVPENEKFRNLDAWMAFEKGLEKSGIRDLKTFCSKSDWWISSCLHVSRKPFYKSPQMRLIYPRGRFYKELQKWFSKRGCLLVSPTAIFGINSRRFSDLPDPFKELLLGYSQKHSGLSTPLKYAESHRFKFTITFFMKEYTSSFPRSVSKYFKQRANASVSISSGNTYRIKYMPVENESDIELLMLGFTYILVFMYILFSVGKNDMLKSRWGLAFSALMTIIMSMMMALGVCASLDLLPTTLTITEIFPYIVIVIGLENVMIITKSVVSIEPDIDVSVRVAKGMGKEGWYITKNICAELAILGAGYYTHIPSVQEFCIFAFVGVLSDFFLQMVFFAPILAVDIRRAEICHLRQITTVQQFAVGFNLMQKTALKLVPPTPPKTRWSRFVEVWLKRRMFQKALMTAALAYIIYAAYHKVELSENEPSKYQDNTAESSGHQSSVSVDLDAPITNLKPSTLPYLESSNNGTKAVSSDNFLMDDENEEENETISWKFLSKQHWPELLTFYHIRFNERSLVVLPPLEIGLSVQLNQTEQTSSLKFTKTSSPENLLLAASFAVIIVAVVYIAVLICSCMSRLQGKRPSFSEAALYKADIQIFKGHKNRVEFVVAEKPYMVSACLSGLVRVWDLKSSECIMEIEPSQRNNERRNSLPNSTLRRRKFSNTDNYQNSRFASNIQSVWCIDCKYNLVAIGYSSGKVEIYNVTGKKAVGRIVEEEPVVVLKIASRNTVVTGRVDGMLDIIEIKRRQLDSVEDIEVGEASPRACAEDEFDTFGCSIKHRIRAHLCPIENLVLFAGLVLCSAKDMIKVYEIDDGNCCNTISSNGNQITTVHRIRESTALSSAIGYEDGSISLINMAGDKAFECNLHVSPVLHITSNSKSFASSDCSDQVLIWTTEDGECKCTEIQNAPSEARFLHFLDDSSLSVISIRGIFIYDAATGELLRQIENDNGKANRWDTNFVCCPLKNTILMAKNRVINHIVFCSLSKQKADDSNR